MNVLFVSLTRFGDLLQTQASINDVVLAGHEVGVVCLHNFLPTVHLMEGIAHVFPFIDGRLLANMASRAQGEDDFSYDENREGWLKATKELKEWRDMVWREFAPDVIINLSPAMTSRLLSSFLSSQKNIGGFSLETQASYHNNSLWASVMQGAQGKRGIIPYNLVDIFRGITADALAQSDSTPRVPSQTFPSFDERKGKFRLLPPSDVVLSNVRNDLTKGMFALGFSDWGSVIKDAFPSRQEQLGKVQQTYLCKNTDKTASHQKAAGGKQIAGFFAIQLGASATERRWSVESFVQVSHVLWERFGLVPILLGTKSELPLAKEYEQLVTSPHISVVGKTGLVDLSAYLLHCLFLLTNDTGTMHLAAGLGVPSFAIFLATAQPFDTGPYLNGCYCFEADIPCHPCGFSVPCPHEYICRKAIKPETVITCLEHFFQTASLIDYYQSPSDEGIPSTLDMKPVQDAPQELLLNAGQPPTASLDGRCLVDSLTGQGARVWLTVIDEKGVLSLQSLVQTTQAEVAHIYARSRGPLVKLQRAVLWAFLRSYESLQESGEAFETAHPDVSALNPSWFMKEAQGSIGQDAERLFGLIDILERQGSVLLLRHVELMQQRFLESWGGVYQALTESLWFCFLASLWVDRTNVSAMDFRELMAVVRIMKGIFEDLARLFAQGD